MSWNKLKQILDDNRRIIEEEKDKEINQCPECAYVPLKMNKHGVKLCPMCGWKGR